MKKISFLCTVCAFFVASSLFQDVVAGKRAKKTRVTAEVSEKNDESESFVSADYATLIDFDTGECLFSKRAEDRFFPSSMTKIMTAYVVFSAIEKGKIRMEDEFPVSEKAQKMEGSRSFFKAGTTAKVEDLLRSIIVHSGNDACVVISEGISGDESAFVDEMNEKAEELGLKNTHFNNSNGLPDSEHYSCASDLAILARRLIADFPQYYHYFSEKSFTVNGITQQNRNVLLGNSMGVDGLKTGKTNASGYGIVVSAKNAEKRLISVVNGCKTARERAQDSSRLLAKGFREFISVKIAEAGRPITTAKVWLGLKDHINLCTHENISVSVPRKYKKLITVEARVIEPVNAPILAGTKIGKLVYKFGSFSSKEYDLFACESIGKLGLVERAVMSVKNLIFGSTSTEQGPETKKIKAPIGFDNARKNSSSE